MKQVSRRSEVGVTAIEYAVMAAAIVAIILAAMDIVGAEIDAMFLGL